jgi:hypothetical protein
VQPELRFWQNEPKVPPFRAIPELGNAVSRESVLSRAERATLEPRMQNEPKDMSSQIAPLQST